MALMRTSVVLLCGAAILLAALTPVAGLSFVPLVFLSAVVAPAGTLARQRRSGHSAFQPFLLALVLAPHRPRAALPAARS